MTPEDQALVACLDARDAVFKAMRLLKNLKVFMPRAYAAVIDAEDSLSQGIQIQLELRQRERAECVA